MLGATGVGQCAFVQKNWMGLSQASERPSGLSALFFQGLLASFQLLLGLRSFGFSWLSCTVSVSVTICKCFPLVLTLSPSYHQSLELGPTLNISIHSHEPYTPYEALFLNNNHILRVWVGIIFWGIAFTSRSPAMHVTSGQKLHDWAFSVPLSFSLCHGNHPNLEKLSVWVLKRRWSESWNPNWHAKEI